MRIYWVYFLDIVYIGSTDTTLEVRWNRHKSGFNQYLKGKGKGCLAIYPYYEKFGIDLFTIEELEQVKEESELVIREQYYMDITNCVNIRRAVRECEHGKQTYHCRECDGNGFCEHKKQRSRCIECGGSSICEHRKQRNQCIECKGGSICEHDKRRSQCKYCNNFYCEPCDKKFSSKSYLINHTTKFH